jgi:GR25 family glycosyltransferase involved in LPS biosynthesis
MLNYIISLQEPTKKMEYLRSFGLDPIWVEGVNGKALSPEAIHQETTSYCKYTCPVSAIGCALAHVKAWREFLMSGEKYGIIFEDDIILEDSFVHGVYNALHHVPDDFDILYLGCFGCDAENVSSVYKMSGIFYGKNARKGRINDFISVPEYAYAAHAYVLSRKGAQKLIYMMEGKIDDHVDMMLHKLASTGQINTYVTTPRLAYQTSTDSTVSENAKSKYPLLLTDMLHKYEIDRMVRADYLSTTAIQQIGSYIINGITIMFLLLGAIAAVFKIPISYLSVCYLLLSVPDLVQRNPENTNAIVVNYFLFILPSMLMRITQMGKK